MLPSVQVKILDQNPDLRVLCPGLQVIELANDSVQWAIGKDINKALGGDHEIEIDKLEVSQPISSIEIALRNETITLSPSFVNSVLLFAVMP